MSSNSSEQGQSFIAKRKVIKLATQNAQRKTYRNFIKPLWSCGRTYRCFQGVLATELLDYINIGFPDFISGGILEISLPTLITGKSSLMSEISYPHNIKTNDQKEAYKTTYQSGIKILRKKPTTLDVGFGVISFSVFISLLISGS